MQRLFFCLLLLPLSLLLHGQKIDLFPLGQPIALVAGEGVDARWVVQAEGIARLDSVHGVAHTVWKAPAKCRLTHHQAWSDSDVVVLDGCGAIRLIDLRNGQVRVTLPPNKMRYTHIATDPKHQLLYALRDELEVHDLRQQKIVARLPLDASKVHALFAGDGLLAVISSHRRATFYEPLKNGTQVAFGGRLFPAGEEVYYDAGSGDWISIDPAGYLSYWSPRGNRLHVRSAAIEQARQIIPLEAGLLAVVRPQDIGIVHKGVVVDTFRRAGFDNYIATLLPGTGQLLIAAQTSDTIWQYDYHQKQVVHHYIHRQRGYSSMGLTHGGQLLWRAGSQLRWWSPQAEQYIAQIDGWNRTIDAHNMPDVHRLHTLAGWSADDRLLQVVDANTGALLQELTDTLGAALSASADGRYLLQKIADGGFRVLDAQGKLKELYRYPPGRPPGLLPDVRYVWEIGSYPQLNTLLLMDVEAGLESVYTVPVGHMVHALGSEVLIRQAQLLYRIDVPAGKRTQQYGPLTNKKDPIVALDPQQQFLAVLDGPTTRRPSLRVYDWAQGTERYTHTLSGESYNELFWLPGQDRLALVRNPSGLVEIREASDFSLIGSFYFLKNGGKDFVAFNPQGEYDGTPAGLSLLPDTLRQRHQPGLLTSWLSTK